MALATYVNGWRQLLLLSPDGVIIGPFPRRDDIASAVIATAVSIIIWNLHCCHAAASMLYDMHGTCTVPVVLHAAASMLYI